MSTLLYLRNTTLNGITGTGDGIVYDMVTAQGSSGDTAVTTLPTVGAATQCTKTAGGSTVAWISGRAPVGGFTLTTTDVDLVGRKYAAADATGGGRTRVYKRTAAGVVSELGGGPFDDGVEWTTTNAIYTWPGNVTDTAFAEDDRILVRFYHANASADSVGDTATAQFNTSDGHNFFNIAETITFKVEAAPVTVSPGVGSVIYTGFAPDIIAGNAITVSPGVGDVQWVGFAPRIVTPVTTSVNASAVYRMTVYVASLDPTASTILTPTGTAHSDAFKVASAQGISGFQPYLDTITGRRGKIDPLSKQVDVGTLTIRLLDKALTPGSNLIRWVTNFFGDTTGVLHLLGCKVYVEESLDGGVTWAPFWVGRIEEASIDADLCWVTLQTKDYADDMKVPCMVGRAHSSVSYVVEPILLPLGLSAPFGDRAAVKPLTATVDTTTYAGKRLLTLDGKSQARLDNLVTVALLGRDLANSHFKGSGQFGLFFGRLAANPALRLRLETCSVGALTGMELRPVAFLTTWDQGNYKIRVKQIAFAAIPSADPHYAAVDTTTIPNGTTCTFTIRQVLMTPRKRSADPVAEALGVADRAARDDPTSDAPILLGSANPAQFMADLLDGKFGELNEDGTVRRFVPRNAASFTALTSPNAATNALPTSTWRFESILQLNDLIEKHICQPYGLAYRLQAAVVAGNPVQEVVLIDMRLPTEAQFDVLPTLKDADLDVSAGPGWTQGRSSAMTYLTVTTYLDEPIDIEDVNGSPELTPDVPAVLFTERKQVVSDYTYGRLELGFREMAIDAKGARYTPQDAKDGLEAVAWGILQRGKVFESYRSEFGTGAASVNLTCRRTSNTSTLQPGDWAILRVDGLPDVATHVRGGPRLAQCTGREEDGPVLKLAFLDAGPFATCSTPTVGAPAAGTPAQSAFTLPITLDANNDPAVVEIAVTATGVLTVPAPNATGWVFAVRVTTSATVEIPNLPSGMRVWHRARSEPASANRAAALPSQWVSNATASIDTTALSAPTGVTVLPSPILTTSTVTASWAIPGGQEGCAVRCSLTTGGVETEVARLDPGSIALELNAFLAASTTYTCQVYHRDGLAGESPAGVSASFAVPGGFGGPSLTTPTLALVI